MLMRTLLLFQKVSFFKTSATSWRRSLFSLHSEIWYNVGSMKTNAELGNINYHECPWIIHKFLSWKWVLMTNLWLVYECSFKHCFRAVVVYCDNSSYLCLRFAKQTLNRCASLWFPSSLSFGLQSKRNARLVRETAQTHYFLLTLYPYTKTIYTMEYTMEKLSNLLNMVSEVIQKEKTQKEEKQKPVLWHYWCRGLYLAS